MLNNKNAKVSTCDRKSEKMLKMIDKYKQKQQHEGRADESSDEEALVNDKEASHEVHTPEKAVEANQNSFNYSLYDMSNDGPKSPPAEVKPPTFTAEQVHSLMNHQPQLQPYSYPPTSTPIYPTLSKPSPLPFPPLAKRK